METIIKKCIKYFDDNRVAIALLIVISMLIYWKWFFNFGSLFFSDWPFRFKETLVEIPLMPQSWISNLNFGVINQSPFTYPIDAIEGIMSRIGFSWNIIERLLFMWPVAIIAPLSSFFLIKKIIPSSWCAFTGALLFSFNTYFLAAFQNGHMNLMVAYSMAPLFILLIIKSQEKRTYINLFYVSLVGFILGAYDFRIFYALVWISFFYLLFYIFTEKKFDIKSLTKSSFMFATPIFIVLLLNAFWLVPFLFHLGGYAIEAITRGVSVYNFTILNSITLGYPLRQFGIGDFNFSQIPFYLWVIPIFGFWGLFLNRKNKLLLFFGFLTLVGVFIGKQTAAPFGGVYYWIFDHVPGFSGFREPSKLYFIIAIGYSVLVSSFLFSIFKKTSDTVFKRYLKYFLIVSILFVSVWNTRLLIDGNLGSVLISKQIPEDYVILKDFISKQPDYFYTLWIPNPSNWAFFTNQHPLAGLDSLVQDWAWKDKISSDYFNGNNPIIGELTAVLDRPNSKNLLGITSIKYVVIPLNDSGKSENYYNLFDLYGYRGFFVNDLNKLAYLQKINIGTKELEVYENKNFSPLFSIQQADILSKFKTLAVEQIDYKYINQTEYKIRLQNVKIPLHINFAQSYDSEWKLHTGDFSWLEALIDKNYFLSDNNHSENDANLNSFLIDPEEVCQANSNCQKNPDGSYNIDMTLYFKPQSYFYLGLIVSSGTLLACFGYLGIYLIKRKIKSLKK
jgi:hypothetical protein